MSIVHIDTSEQAQARLDAANALVALRRTAPPAAADVTQSRYLRTVPSPGGFPFNALLKDPHQSGANGTGRVWGYGGPANSFGYTDDDGAIFVDCGPNPSIAQMVTSPANDITTTKGLKTIASASGLFASQNLVNKVIDDGNVMLAAAVVSRCTVLAVAGDGSWADLSAPTFVTGNTTFTVAIYPNSEVTPSGDIGTVADSNRVTSASHFWAARHVGAPVSGGVGILLSAPYIASVQDAQHATMGDAAIGTGLTAVNLGSVQTMVQLEISANWMWLLTAGVHSQEGMLFRAPAPGAAPGPIVWTLVQDLSNRALGFAGANAPGGINSCYRNAELAVAPDESAVFLGEYGNSNRPIFRPALSDATMALGSDILASAAAHFAGWEEGESCTVLGAGIGGGSQVFTISQLKNQRLAMTNIEARGAVVAQANGVTFTPRTVGPGQVCGIPGSLAQPGPSIWRSDNPAAATPTFVLAKSFPWGKHVHALKVVTDPATGHMAPFGFVGDVGGPLPSQGGGTPSISGSDVGLWAAQSLAGTWTMRSTPGPYPGLMVTGINLFPARVDGQDGLVAESDTRQSIGPLFWRYQRPDKVDGLVPLCQLRPGGGTMRCLHVTDLAKNMWWLATGESGGVSTVDEIYFARDPYQVPVMLEQAPAGTLPGSFGNAVECNGYLWMGQSRILLERFVGQVVS